MRKPCSSRSSVAEKKAREPPWEWNSATTPGRRPVFEGRCGPGLRGDHQPVGVPVPAHGEEPLRVRRILEPAQPHLEEPCRDGTVGQLHLLGDVCQSPHRAGGDRDPRRQVGVLGLDVDAPRSENVVVADAVSAGQSAGVVDQVSHRPRSGASGSHVSPRRPPSRGPPYTGEQGLPAGYSVCSIYLLP